MNKNDKNMKIQYASDLHLEFAENRNFIEDGGIVPVGDVFGSTIGFTATSIMPVDRAPRLGARCCCATNWGMCFMVSTTRLMVGR